MINGLVALRGHEPCGRDGQHVQPLPPVVAENTAVRAIALSVGGGSHALLYQPAGALGTQGSGEMERIVF